MKDATLTIEDAAFVADVTKQAILSAIRAKRLKAKKNGQRWEIQFLDLRLVRFNAPRGSYGPKAQRWASEERLETLLAERAAEEQRIEDARVEADQLYGQYMPLRGGADELHFAISCAINWMRRDQVTWHVCLEAGQWVVLDKPLEEGPCFTFTTDGQVSIRYEGTNRES